MDSETGRLPELFTNRISGNEELRLLSIGEIHTRIAHARPAPEMIAAVEGQLDSFVRDRSKRQRMIAAFQMLGVCAFLWILGGLAWRCLDFYQAGAELQTNMADWPLPVPSVELPDFLTPKPGKGPVGGRLSMNDAMFLIGVPSDSSYFPYPKGDQADDLGLWQRALSKTWQIPEPLDEFLVDLPKDGQIDLLASGLVSPCAVSTTMDRSDPAGVSRRIYQISYSDKFKHSLTLLKSAPTRPRFTDDSAALNRRVVSLLPPRKDCLTEIVRSVTLNRAAIQPVNGDGLARIVGAEAQRCVRDRDVEGFDDLLKTWRWTNEHLGRAESDIRFLRESTQVLMKCAESLKLEEKARDVAAIRTRLVEYDSTKTKSNADEMRWFIDWQRYGPLRHEGFVHDLSEYPQLPREEFAPMRTASHAMVMGLLSLPAAGAFWVLAIIFAVHRFRHGKQARLISWRLPELLTLADALWILTLGLMLPLLWFLFVTIATPWSVRIQAQNLGFLFLQCTNQQTAMVSLMLLSAILVARWRIYRRCAVIGFSRPGLALGLGCVVLTAAAIPVLGLYSYPDLIGMVPYDEWFKKHSDDGYEFFLFSGGLVLFPAWLWLGITTLRALLGSREHALARVTLSRVMVYTCAAGILINTAMVPLWHAVECHWVSKDTLFDIIPETGMTRIEHEFLKLRQKEFEKFRNSP